MKSLQSKIAIRVNDQIYKKDPLSSELGQLIIRNSINMIDDIGIEVFTFRKLASDIGSTEASIYRYFDSKHKLLAYLTVWYWGWLDYRIAMATQNIHNMQQCLKNAIRVLTEEVVEDRGVEQVNEVKLNRIVIRESSKVYLSKQVDEDNEHGFFSAYKEVVQRVADIILAIRPKFKYPHMLVSTIIEGAHHQRFFAEHLPRLTDLIEGEDAVTTFYIQMAERELQLEPIPSAI